MRTRRKSDAGSASGFGLVSEIVTHLAAFRPWTFLISDGPGRENLFCESPKLENPHIARYVERNDRFLTQVGDLVASIPAGVIEVVLLGHVAEMRNAIERLEEFPQPHRVKAIERFILRDLPQSPMR